MRRLFIIALLATFSIGDAQITVTKDALLRYGTIYVLNFQDTLPVTVGTASHSAQVFDLKSLPWGTSDNIIEGGYGPIDSFPIANYATVTTNGNTHHYTHDFYYVSDSAFAALGSYDEIGGGSPLGVNHWNPPVVLYALPLTPGTAWTTIYPPDSNGTYVTFDTVYSTCDAFGTIVLPDTLYNSGFRAPALPGGSHQCLRIAHRDHSRTDSSGVLMDFNQSVSYEFLTKEGMVIAVAPANADSNASTLQSASVRLTVPESPVGVNGATTLSPETSMQVYPSPLTFGAKNIIVQYYLPEAAAVEFSMTNVLGVEIEHVHCGRQSSGQHTFALRAPSCSAGLYQCSLRCGSTLIPRRILLTK